MTEPTTIHLLTGGIGSGKTTYARSLAARDRCVVFSIDDWMAGLFGPDMPQPIDFEWIMARVRRCEARITETGLAVATCGTGVVLDLGFTSRASRRQMANRIQAAGFRSRLHWLDAPAALRWKRVEERNANRGASYALHVSRPMFDFFESRYEAPDADEMALWPDGGLTHERSG